MTSSDYGTPEIEVLRQTLVPEARPRPLAADADACHVEHITSLSRLEALVPRWDALADAATVPAIMQEPSWVIPSLRHLHPEGVETLAVWRPDETAARNGSTLIGMVTVTPANWQWGLPGGPLKSMISSHVFNGTPLLHREHAAQALAALFRQIRMPFLFESVADMDPVTPLLDRAAAACGRKIEWFDAFERGVLTCDRPSDLYLLDTHSRGRRNKFRRWRKQLGKMQTLRMHALEPGERLDAWIAAFEGLEAKGWKGRAQTAIACSATDTAFFRDALTMMHARGRLLFWQLTLGDQPVAMLFGMRHGRHVSLGKFTYDEDHAKQSPGALLLLDVMDWAYARGDIDFIDACGRPGNAMIDALWAERLTVSDCLVSSPDCSPAVFGAQCKAESARRALRNTAKSVYHNVRAVTRRTP